ncbi:MAG: family 20 glycosylhydrolase [Candidatus Hydrogenedentes bacterium]|nr:family 20 glycosylhydrolase [Candidatus Hydrogenedentota bacterium]
MIMIAQIALAAVSLTAAGDEVQQPWRGVHVMAWGVAGGEEGLPALKRAITEVLVPLGVNTLVYEVGYNFEFESHPDMRFDKITTKAAARDLAAHCRANGIRLIPQFNCLGHQSWAKGGLVFPLMAKHPDMEEIPDVPEANRPKLLKSWCPKHPGVNDIIFDLLDEIVLAFEADAIHVGMDEVLVIGSPKCPRCAGQDPAHLFAQAVMDIHDHVVCKRGWKMLMWGDRLLDASVPNMGNGWEASDKGTAPAIDLIPKDIIICDWHYSVQPDYPSVRLFLEKRFKVWPAGYKNKEAALALVKSSQRDATDRMLGYLGTSWVLQPGYFAEALLGEGEGDLEARMDRAIPAAEALKACMERLKISEPREQLAPE